MQGLPDGRRWPFLSRLLAGVAFAIDGWTDIRRGGATVLKVGGQKVIRERNEREKKFVPPTFGKVGVQFFYTWGYEQGNKYHH